MKSIGFPISKKENEKRRALILNDIKKIKNKSSLYFEKGYGHDIGFSDQELSDLGCHIVTRNEVLTKDIIVDPKIGDAEYLDALNNQILFGWVHAVQNRDITNKLIKHKLTAYAWEDMFEEGRHVFWRNNEIAGEAAIMHAFQCYGIMPYNTKVALIGRGNVANGALKILTLLGADVTIYSRKTENLLRKELSNYDVIVNAILWDTKRTDHIIYKEDLKRMKTNSMIIDISCDKNGGIESSIPTTIESPIYFVDGIIHYVVDHTPSLFYKTTSISISEQVCKYIDDLCCNNQNTILNNAKCIENGKIIDKRIIEFQCR
ncbi:N(5)-(carboxyethyl)ornithine synthase [Traorella massiliensis]|uniref:N(5)-(carboxyethyl)ornithine synthase n=1 Tax=Traorella massiliensis TaxID=1903263 RepID=UPI0023531F11|nr:N(5)-(carboxyethyl)ornithine synthase [Traorella massiliensis]